MTEYWTEAQALAGELSELRKAFHRRPELGNREWETAARIEAFLRSCGIETERLLDTAVIGRLRGAGDGPCVALRADMDALPIQEATGADFASEVPEVMHACGHDVHLAAVLGAAKLLSSHRDRLAGSVVFLFQPDEEGDGGARRLIDAGVLTGVDYSFSRNFYVGMAVEPFRYSYGVVEYRPQEGLANLGADTHFLGAFAAPRLKIGFLF